MITDAAEKFFEEVLAGCDPEERADLLYRRLGGHVGLTHMGKVELKDIDELLAWTARKIEDMTTLRNRLILARAEIK